MPQLFLLGIRSVAGMPQTALNGMTNSVRLILPIAFAAAYSRFSCIQTSPESSTTPAVSYPADGVRIRNLSRLLRRPDVTLLVWTTH